ncbi:fibrinogen-like protein 1 [Sander lucioperca]|nr:fibrinogen-like protein 1 [Sander lucioperca]
MTVENQAFRQFLLLLVHSFVRVQRRMGSSLLLFTGLMVIAACSHFLCASDTCDEEVARLQEKQRLLQGQLQKQELLLHRLHLLNQPGNTDTARPEQSQDTQYTDCSELFSSGSKSSGFYTIKPHSSPHPVRVYCDMSDGGGWIVIQRRIDGTQRFNRSWAEYKDGFGDMDAEFWLGNDNLHYITTQGNYSLRINLGDFDGYQRYAEYKNFKVANEKDHYRLTFGTYVGTAGDSLSGTDQVGVSEWASHQDMKFSTYDQDNDNYKGNCAQEDKGGWWFNKCHSAHLNGMYYPNGHYSALTDDGVVWYTWKGWWYSLKTSIMKLRPIDFKMDPINDPNAVQHRLPF